MTTTTAPDALTVLPHSVPHQGPIDTALARVECVARRVAVPFVRLALALLMLWFGIPKLIPGGSPAEDIAVRTAETLSSGTLAGPLARLAVGGFEIVIGVALVIGRAMPLVLVLVLVHMAGTVTPLVLFPSETWHSPGVGTLEGQYIIKNVVIVAGVVVLAGWGMRRSPVGQSKSASSSTPER